MASDVAILFTGCLLFASATMDYSEYIWKEGLKFKKKTNFKNIFSDSQKRNFSFDKKSY